MEPAVDRPFGDWLTVFGTAPGVGVALVSADLRLLYANAATARMYTEESAEAIINRPLSALFPPAWVEQRAAVVERVLATGRPVIIRSIMKGRQIEATILALPADPNDQEGSARPQRVLVISVEGETPAERMPEGAEIIESETADLGPLAVLTPRELEVLALIGQGHSAKEIAGFLTCSPRTVERHRDAIGKKLEKNDRVKLAMVAKAAGLRLRDAQVTRITLPPGPSREGRIEEVKPAPTDAPAGSTRPPESGV